jgi:hypothetical protein
MPLFRRQRATLEDSLKTTIIVRNKQELREEIKKDWEMWFGHPGAAHCNFNDFNVKVFIPYDLPLELCFDARCGWFCHYVSADLMCKDEYMMVGFLSEPMEN